MEIKMNALQQLIRPAPKSINNKLKQDDMTSSVVATQAKMKDLEKPSGFMPEDELYALLWDNVFTGDKRNFNWKL